MTERRHYQQRVADLLELIETRSRERLRLEAAGFARPLLAGLEQQEKRARTKLAELTAFHTARPA